MVLFFSSGINIMCFERSGLVNLGSSTCKSAFGVFFLVCSGPGFLSEKSCSTRPPFMVNVGGGQRSDPQQFAEVGHH